jgi:hypothetical protein
MASKPVHLALLTLVVSVAGCGRETPSTSAEVAPPAPAAPAPAAVDAPVADPATAATPSIGRIVDGSLVGTKLSFFERFAGQPTYATVDKSDYRIAGCDVSALTDGETVHAIRIASSADCTAVLPGFSASLALNGEPTFADFERAFADAAYKAPCTGRYCGNAFEPYFDAVVPGPHANNFVDYVASAYFIADASDAGRVWEAHMQAEAGDAFLEDQRFNCDRRFDAAARAAFAAIKVDSVTFGPDIDTLKCAEDVRPE